jgi:hypothetical protein
MDAAGNFRRAALSTTSQLATQGATAVQNLVTRVTANGMNQLRLQLPSGETVINFGKAAAIGLAYALTETPAAYIPKGGRSRRYKKSIKNKTRKIKY